MMQPKEIQQITEQQIGTLPLYLVDVTVSPSDEICVTVDSDTSVSVDDCVELNNRLSAALEPLDDDFALTVTSAGIGQPLRVLRQYRKLVGSSVEVVLKNGTKITAVLAEADADSITLSYDERVAVEGKKRKETVNVTRKFPLSEVAQTVEYLDYK